MGLQATYTASVDVEDITIIRDVRAGICGPYESLPLPAKEFTVDELVTALTARGYTVTGEWKAVVCYDGIRLEAAVTPS